MMPIQPQSILKIFLNSIKTYGKVFMSILPISAIFVCVQFSGGFALLENGLLFLVVTKIAVFLLSFFCFCWGACFLYDFITNQDVSHKSSFNKALKRFVPAIISPIIWMFLIIMVVVFVWAMFHMLQSFNIFNIKLILAVMGMLVLSLFALLILVAFTFNFLYPLEILFKSTKILPAVVAAKF